MCRPGQTRPAVHLFLIEVIGPCGEEYIDGQSIRRNTDQGTVGQATNIQARQVEDHRCEGSSWMAHNSLLGELEKPILG